MRLLQRYLCYGDILMLCPIKVSSLVMALTHIVMLNHVMVSTHFMVLTRDMVLDSFFGIHLCLLSQC